MAKSSLCLSSFTVNSLQCFPFKGYGTHTKYYLRLGLKGHVRQRRRSTLAGIVAISSVASSVIDARIAAAKCTGRLDLSECGLSEVPKEVFYILDLEDLSLSGNNISIIPNEIGNLKRLCRLGLAGNRLEELPASIGELKQLRGLWVHGNILKYLPEEIGDLPQLRILALAGNKLKSLPNAVMELSNLQVLSVCGNCLEKIPLGIGCLQSLTSLALHGNQLCELPESLAHLSSLQELWLQGNRLEALTLDCGSLKMLKELSLADNKISCISESIGELQALESFWLYGNMLSKVPCNLANMKALSNLWLEGNMLDSVQFEKLLPNFSHLRALGIDNSVKLGRNVPSDMQKVLKVSEILGTGAAPLCGGYFKLEHSVGTDQVQINTNTVVVAFGSAPGVPNWGGLLRRVKAEMTASNILPAFDILYVVDGRRSWYTEHQNMIKMPSKIIPKPLHEENNRRICQYFYNELEEALKNYKAILMLGDSMGASAALTFSSLATSVIAFCPQVDLESSSIRPAKDKQWMKAYKDDLLKAVLTTKSRVTVHCGSWSHDIHQANLLPSNKVNIVTHGIDDHRLAKQLDNQGKLIKIVKSEILAGMDAQQNL
ncbi:hypothetical protein SUGI_0425120 [Cryptomeria japonica]|uniref:uncharacterized protein LOC131032188 isoform X2 n=1 Tax=Cryptomeria japonica TaxID=3369 RepID=UPI002408CC9B|nr:uncharacterized protein LOC131032188 isoform X2 [Cryptomeria japonica]GLJ22585.1 hypothetical protein SUGI_0425120 [Cryptomeria japonica]